MSSSAKTDFRVKSTNFWKNKLNSTRFSYNCRIDIVNIFNIGKLTLDIYNKNILPLDIYTFDCYNAIPAKYKTDLFTSPIKIKAANGTLIENKGECDITFKIGPIKFTFPFLCSAELSQQFILGYNFPKAFHIGTTWSADDIMSLTYQGKPIAHTISTKEINFIVFCCESTIIPPFSNAKIKCRAPKVKSRANCGHNLLFEPSNRHKSNYVNCNTYNGLVTFDEHTASAGSFDIVMTNNSNQHVKVTKNQTLGMLKSCDQDQICTIHKLVTFEPKS